MDTRVGASNLIHSFRSFALNRSYLDYTQTGFDDIDLHKPTMALLGILNLVKLSGVKAVVVAENTNPVLNRTKILLLEGYNNTQWYKLK